MGALKVFTLVDTFAMTATLFYAARPPTVLVIGGSEGGMKRAIACSLDVATGALCRETVY
jgi:spermidine synthase